MKLRNPALNQTLEWDRAINCNCEKSRLKYILGHFGHCTFQNSRPLSFALIVKSFKMKWYETQIIGVIVGGLIVFCSNWFAKWNENRQECNKLKAVIYSEIKIFSDILSQCLVTIEQYQKDLEESGTISKSKITGNFEFSFIDSNMAKIGILDKPLIKLIIEIRGLRCAFAEGLNILIELIPSFHELKIKEYTIKTHLISAENSIKKMQQINNQIIHLTKG